MNLPGPFSSSRMAVSAHSLMTCTTLVLLSEWLCALVFTYTVNTFNWKTYLFTTAREAIALCQIAFAAYRFVTGIVLSCAYRYNGKFISLVE